MWLGEAQQTKTRRQWTTPDKLRIVAESWQPGSSANSVARRHHISPNLIFRWRRLVRQGLLGNGTVSVPLQDPELVAAE
jgi:transposase-like protein